MSKKCRVLSPIGFIDRSTRQVGIVLPGQTLQSEPTRHSRDLRLPLRTHPRPHLLPLACSIPADLRFPTSSSMRSHSHEGQSFGGVRSTSQRSERHAYKPIPLTSARPGTRAARPDAYAERAPHAGCARLHQMLALLSPLADCRQDSVLVRPPKPPFPAHEKDLENVLVFRDSRRFKSP